MRKIILLILCIVSISTHAQDLNYEIIVDKDMSIDIRDMFKLPANTFLYGEVYNKQPYGGEEEVRFQNKQVKPNNSAGIKIERKDGKILADIDFDNIKDDTSHIVLNCAKFITGSGWCADADNQLVIRVIKKQVAVTPDNPSEPVVTVNPIEIIQSEVITLQEECKYLNYFKIVTGINLLCIILLLIYVLYKVNRKNTQKIKPLTNDEIIHLIKKQILEHEKNQNKDDKANDSKKQKGLSRAEVESLIASKINSLTHSNPIQHHVPQDITGKQKVDFHKKKEEATNSFETDDVIFDTENAIFRIGKTDIKIFRIYSKGADFFYTIPDNNNIRTEFVDMIPSFTSFVTMVDANASNAKKVEPVKDGRLIKAGDEFMVDQNSKLELRFV